MKLGCTTGGRSPMPPPAAKGGREAGEVIHRKMRLESQGFAVLSVLVNKGPAPFGLPIGKSEKPMLQKVLRMTRRLGSPEIGRARHELMAVRSAELNEAVENI